MSMTLIDGTSAEKAWRMAIARSTARTLPTGLALFVALRGIYGSYSPCLQGRCYQVIVMMSIWWTYRPKID
jgi:hypothetical protein